MRFLVILALLLASLGAGFAISAQVRMGALTERIQDERAASLRATCDQQNKRNGQAVRAAFARLDGAPDQFRRQQIVVDLVDALAPVRNCDELARERVRARP